MSRALGLAIGSFLLPLVSLHFLAEFATARYGESTPPQEYLGVVLPSLASLVMAVLAIRQRRGAVPTGVSIVGGLIALYCLAMLVPSPGSAP